MNKFRLVGVLTLFLVLGLNLSYSINGYSINANRLFSAGSSSSTSSSTTNEGRIKQCRTNVKCRDTWVGSATIDGCITIHGVKICGQSVGITINYPYTGLTEHCTGGFDWFDCDACQSHCIPTKTSH